MTEPTSGLHDLLLDPTRLRIVAVVAPATQVEFRLVREATGLSDSALSKQLRVLSEARIVELEKRRTGPARSRTWINLTVAGREALTAHIAALTEIAGQPPPT
ncbi:transcriptional regulator [Microlunatus speluncae]|uniref:transcriptional regulator n=1 Tax=Microlunatus speluncae TaxID=2594267 RepID=UPI0012664E83|nr:transcriptional regulator [Microlunatus speluncae]